MDSSVVNRIGLNSPTAKAESFVLRTSGRLKDQTTYGGYVPVV